MLRPMTVSGRSMATRGSWAVPEAPASRAMRTPGLINPPVYWPIRLMTEAVVAAPMSKMTIGGVYRSRAATAPATRLAPQLGRVVNPDVEPRLHPGADHQRPMAGDLFQRPGDGEIGRRDNRGDNRPFDAGGGNAV